MKTGTVITPNKNDRCPLKPSTQDGTRGTETRPPQPTGRGGHPQLHSFTGVRAHAWSAPQKPRRGDRTASGPHSPAGSLSCYWATCDWSPGLCGNVARPSGCCCPVGIRLPTWQAHTEYWGDDRLHVCQRGGVGESPVKAANDRALTTSSLGEAAGAFVPSSPLVPAQTQAQLELTEHSWPRQGCHLGAAPSCWVGTRRPQRTAGAE